MNSRSNQCEEKVSELENRVDRGDNILRNNLKNKIIWEMDLTDDIKYTRLIGN